MSRCNTRNRILKLLQEHFEFNDEGERIVDKDTLIKGVKTRLP